jgi:hypothetical protein
MNIKKLAGTAAIAAGLGAAGIGLGAGSAQADQIWVPDIPGIPGAGHWVDQWDPGYNWGPPGQVKKECAWGVIGPCGTPPGHWPNGPQGPPPIFPGQR